MKSLFKFRAGAAGFSVIELLVTVGIAGLLMGIAVPGIMSWIPGLRLSSAATQIATDLQVARIKAISQNTNYTVTFNTSAGTYTYGTETRSLPLLYPGITISSVSANPVFTSRGTASANVTITLNNGSTQKRVCVRTVGRVNVTTATTCS